MFDDDINYAVNVDSDCISADFDAYDLYGERIEENEYDELSENLVLQ